MDNVTDAAAERAALVARRVQDAAGAAQPLAGHARLVPLLTLAEWVKWVQPVADKRLLRSPEVLLGVLAQLLARVTFDASTLVPAYAEPFASNLRANNAEQRALALAAVKALAAHVHDAGAASTLAGRITALLASALPSIDHRLVATAALRALCACPLPAEQQPAFAQGVIDASLPILQKEANETAYAALAGAIGQFAGQLRQPHAPLTAFIDAGLKSDKVHARRLLALLIALELPAAVLAQSEVFMEPLVKAAEKAAQSAVLSAPEGLAELLALLRLRGTNARAEQDLAKKGFWDTQLGPASFVYQDKVYMKLSADDAVVLARVLQAVLRELAGSAVVAKSLKQLMTTLVFSACLGPWQGRRLVRSFTPELLAAHLEYAAPLAQALHDVMAQMQAQPAKYETVADKRDYATFLSSVLHGNKDIDAAQLEARLLASFVPAHHALVGRPVWAPAIKSLPSGKDFVAQHLAQLLAQITSTDPAQLAALRTAAKLAPTEVVRGAVKLALDALAAVKDEAVSDTDLGIYRTEEGQLFVDVLAKREAAASLSVAPRGGRRDHAYSFEDELWEQQVRKELAAKRAQDAKRKLTKEEEALVKAQHEKEAAVRARVAGIRARQVFALSLVDALAEAVHEAMEDAVPQIVQQIVFPLLASPLAHREAGQTFMTLSTCVAPTIRGVARYISVIWMRLKNSSGLPAEWRSASVKDVAAATLMPIYRAVDQHGSLSAAAFFFVFLIVEPLLTDQKHVTPEEAQQLLELTNAHAKHGYSPLLPRAAMMRLYLRLIKQSPALSKPAHTGLVALCTAVADSVGEDETRLLLHALLDGEVNVRQAALDALKHVPAASGPLAETYIVRVWLTTHDATETVAAAAKALWEPIADRLPRTYSDDLLSLLVHDEVTVRDSAGRAFSAAIATHPSTLQESLSRLYGLYKVKAALPEVQYDEFGRPIKQEFKDPVHLRVSIADAVKECTKFMGGGEDLRRFVSFLIVDGFADRSEAVRVKMLEAALAALKEHGKENVDTVLPIVETYLNQPAPPSEVHDRIRESVILLVGELAAFLDPKDPKVPAILARLVDTLKTPSEQVQVAVANCLPGLVKSIDVADLVQQMMKQVLDGTKYGDRRGAAYGLAGLVKGKGISALKDFNIMTQLKDAMEDKKVMQHRQGALFAYETLSLLLGRLFEPYVIQILPLLLVAFGDGSVEVREAVADASRVIMSKLSAHCVKLILPSLLVGLSDEQWRTKQGSAELLGAMAYLAPKQLGSSLPTIVPKLADILADSHPKVVTAGKQALQHIGSVIKNPEIQALVPLLLRALVEPNRYTSESLTALMQTAFVHVVDAPSLALIAPILQRGLKERSTDTKKMAAQIMGNMSSLVDEKDFVPYLPVLIPGVQTILVDPIPEVRKIAARALGTMVTKMGEKSFEGLIPWLLTMLKSESSSVDRSGAAQGLSEVLRGLGASRLDALLPDIITNATSPSPHVREGCLSVLIYLPSNFGEEFTRYLAQVIPPVLKGLADEAEPVRDVALRAGQVIVANYSRSAVELLLPSLQKGLFDDNWRIRSSSVQLLGDLLYRITGATGKTQLDGADEEEGIGTEEGRRAVLAALGQERRDLVLASLYVLRNDISLVVRQSSLHVWKTVVSNTPRTLREILPVMMRIIIDCLSSPSHDKRTVGARCLGELVRKQGDRVLPEVMPTLEEGLLSPVATTRQGVCIGLNEIMLTAGKQLVVQFIDVIVPAVRQAISDPDPMVREPAADAFDTLFKNVGRVALDEILPHLLHNLASSDDAVVSAALEGLQLITAVRSNIVFPILIEQLLHPITAANARALGMLIPSAGKALTKYLSTILSSLFQMTAPSSSAKQAVDRAAIDATATVLLSTVSDDDAGRLLMSDLLEKAASDKAYERKTACDFIATFCASSKIDYTPYVRAMFRLLLYRMNDVEQDVVSSAWGALDALTRTLKKEHQPDYLNEVRRAMQNVVDDARPAVGLIKGFCMPRGILPLLPMMLQGLLYGSNDVREQAALGMGDLVRFTDPESLKPMVVQMTGPLIRIVGDRFNWQVKAAILETLGLLLGRVGIALRPFLPQLQSTFVRALHDTTQDVRIRAASALGRLIPLQPRVDPLITELLNGIKTCEPGIRETFLRALYAVVRAGASTIGAPVRAACQAALVSYLGETDDDVRTAAAHCLGALSKAMGPADARALVRQLATPEAGASVAARLGAAQALTTLLQESPEALLVTDNDAEARAKIAAWIMQQVQDDKIPLVQTGLRSLAYALLPASVMWDEHGAALIGALALGLSDKKPTDARLIAAAAFKSLAKAQFKLLEPHLGQLVPPLLSAAQEKKILRLKLAAERALLYGLGLRGGEQTLQAFLACADADTAKALADYHRRVLSKLAQRSASDDGAAGAGDGGDVSDDDQEMGRGFDKKLLV